MMEEASSLFQEHGFIGTTLRMISDKVGVTAAAVYWYFPSKSHILYSILERGLDEIEAALEDAMIEAAPRERLGQFVHAVVLFRLRRTDIAPVKLGVGQLIEVLPKEMQTSLNERQHRYLDLVRGILQAGIEEGSFRDLDVTTTGFAILTLCDYVFVWFRHEGRLTPEEVASEYERLVIASVMKC
jgi:AcrR family transcriptional regulator